MKTIIILFLEKLRNMFNKKKPIQKEDTIEDLFAKRVELEKKIKFIDEDILKLQMKCPHHDFSDYDKLDGTGVTVCNDCFAELARLY